MSNLIYKSILAHDFYNFVQMKRNLGYKLYISSLYSKGFRHVFVFKKH